MPARNDDALRKAAFDAWVARAKAVPIQDAAERRGIAPGASLKERHGPCPACGGRDRFVLNIGLQTFYCRGCKASGKVVDFVMFADGCGFLAACQTLTGSPPPGADGTRSRAEIEAEQARLAGEAQARDRRRAAREAESERHRERERERCAAIWRAARPAAGTPVEAYLARRRLSLPPGDRLRYDGEAQYWDLVGGAQRVVHTGPAMVARITRGGELVGVHRTWIDLEKPKGKAEIVHPETGEILAPRKTRGSKKGGWIILATNATPARAVIGEGIETVLTVHEAMLEAGRDLSATLFAAAIDLDNIGGEHAGQVRHPTRTTTDKLGRVRPVRVAGPVPKPGGRGLVIPPSVVDVVTLAERKPDVFTVEQVHRRAAARWTRPGLVVRTAWPPDGHDDFNDMRLAQSLSDGGAL